MSTLARNQSEQIKRNEQPTDQQKAAALEEHAIAPPGEVIWIDDDYGCYGEFSVCSLHLDPTNIFERALRSAAAHAGDRIIAIESTGPDFDGYILRGGGFHYVCSYGLVCGPKLRYKSSHNKPVSP